MMSINNKLISYIEQIEEECYLTIIKIKGLTNISNERKQGILADLEDIVLSAAADAKQSIINNPKSPYFLLPFQVCLLHYGEILGIIGESNVLSNLRSGYAKARHEKDPKQAEKTIVFECWNEWQKKPDQYKNNTKFASAMIEKFKPDNQDDESKHLNSVKVITDWCREWKKSKSAS